MIDAYTIGITLALDDGVSSGIAAIRKELMLLDGAVQSAASAMSGMHALAGVADWTRFGDISAKSLGRPVSTPAPIAAETLQAFEPVAPPVQSSSPVTMPDWPAERVRPFTPMAMPAATEVSVQPAPAVVRTTPPPPPSPATVRPDEPPSRKTAPVVPAPPTAAAPTVPQSAPRAEAPSAPAAVLPEKLALLAGRILPEPLAGTNVPPPQLPATTAPQRAPLPQRPELSLDIIPTVYRQEQPSAPFAAIQTTTAIETAIAAQQAAPSPTTKTRAAPPDAQDDRRSVEPSMPPDAAPQFAQADLYIDGAVLGRWVTRHLERQLIRPPSGIAAVDPRLTPGWAGPATGF